MILNIFLLNLKDIILIYLLFINFLSILFMAIDKYKAIKKRYRISEKFLITISFIGGCYGTIISMIIFNHKNKKTSIKLWFYFSFFVVTSIIILIDKFL